MMRWFLWAIAWLALGAVAEEKLPVVRVYTYDAFTGKGSFAEYLTQEFQKKGGQVEWISFGTAGEALNQILLEGGKTRADILVGLDPILIQKVAEKNLFEPIPDTFLKELNPDLVIQGVPAFVPYDYGYLAFVYDALRTPEPPETSLAKFVSQLKKTEKIVLQDPRTSSLGLEFLVWSHEALGSAFKDFWIGLSKHILTISPGWSGAYELFLRKQADYVLSYTTSPAYHKMRENKHHIKSLFFKEGHFRQVEGLVLLKTSQKKESARKLIELILSAEAQTKLPTFQWMYPARLKVELPREFREIPVPKTVAVDWVRVHRDRDQWLKDWTWILSK